MRREHIAAPVTGQTAFYGFMMQEWASQNWQDRSIESYCLDAPNYIPTGGTHLALKGSRFQCGQSEFTLRPGTV